MERAVRVSFAIALLGSATSLHPATAAHAQVGTPVPDPELSVLGGGQSRVLAQTGLSVLVFYRPAQPNSLSGLKALAECQKDLAGKPLRWVAIVSDAAPADDALALVRNSGLQAPVLVDAGDALYGSLGIALHPVVVIVGSDRRLAAFEPFHSVNYCAIVSARIRRALGEISEAEMQQILDPPRATESGSAPAAHRYRALAEALLKAKKPDKALVYARRSVEQDDTYAAAHALLGEVLAAQGNCAEAVPAFRRALELDPAAPGAAAGIKACPQ